MLLFEECQQGLCSAVSTVYQQNLRLILMNRRWKTFTRLQCWLMTMLTHKSVFRRSGDSQSFTARKGHSGAITTGTGSSQTSGCTSSDPPVRKSQ